MGYSGNELKLAKSFTNDQIIQKATNSPTQTVSFDGGVYSLPSNVVNGQVSDVVMKGVTRTNLVESSNMDTDTDANGIVDDFTSAVGPGVTLTFSLNNGSQKVEITGSTTINDTQLRQPVLGVNAGDIISARVEAMVDGNVEVAIGLLWYQADGTTFITSSSGAFTSPTSNTTIKLENQIAPALAGKVIICLKTRPKAIGNVGVAWFKNAMLEKAASVGNYIKSGTKSTNSVRLKSVGKNLFDGELEKGNINTADGQNWTQGDEYVRSKDYIRIPSSEYRLSHNLSAVSNIVVYYYDANKNYISGVNVGSATVPLVPLAGAVYMRFRLYEEGGTLNPATTQVIINSGSVAVPYESYKRNELYTPPFDGKSLPNGVKDEVNVTAGVKTQNVSDDKPLPTSGWTYRGKTDDNNFHIISNDLGFTDIFHSSVAGIADYFTFSNKSFVTYTTPSLAVIQATYKLKSIIKHSTSSIFYLVVPNAEYTQTTDSAGANAYVLANLSNQSLTYQLATPIVTDIPKQKLEVFENGTVYVEPIGDASESTLPSVEMTIPTGTSNKFGVASHDYDGAAADWTLTNSESKCFMLAVSNAGGAANIIAPNRPGTMYAISNASGYAITIKKSGGTGVAVTNAKTVLVIHNGTDYSALTAEL